MNIFQVRRLLTIVNNIHSHLNIKEIQINFIVNKL